VMVKVIKDPLIYLERKCIEALRGKLQHNIVVTNFIYDIIVVFCSSLFTFSTYRLLYDLGVNTFFAGMIIFYLLAIFSCTKYRRENLALKFLVAFLFASMSCVLITSLDVDLPIIKYYFAALMAIFSYFSH